VALNYGEAQSAESRKDFIHKMKVVLKELGESFVCLKILFRIKSFKSEKEMTNAMKECDELISIFVKSIETAKRNMLQSAK
jgi:four helix bundle protein